MTERKLIIHNFKKLKKGEYGLKDVNAFIGKNRSGKTSLVEAIQSMYLMNGFVKQPLNDSSKDGSVQFIGKDKNDKEITIKWEFDKDGNNIFTAIIKDEHGKSKPISNPKKILELLGTYYPLTVQEFFQKCKYAEGRKEIIEKYLYLCLTEKQREELDTLRIAISDKSNTKTTGNLYFQRRDLNKDIDVLNKVVANVNLTEEEQKLIDNEKKFKDTAIVIKKDIEDKETERKKLQEQLTVLNLSITEQEERLTKAENLFVRINEIKKRVNSEVDNKLQLANKTTLLQNIEKQIAINKEKIKNIYKNSKLPAGLEIEEESFSLNGLQFDETITSESEGYLAIIELMCQISDSDLLCIGSWETFDAESKNKIIALSEKYSKFVIGTQVVDDLEEPKVITIIKK
jgi:predicted ATP-dependent endonuclease of OLD family